MDDATSLTRSNADEIATLIGGKAERTETWHTYMIATALRCIKNFDNTNYTMTPEVAKEGVWSSNRILSDTSTLAETFWIHEPRKRVGSILREPSLAFLFNTSFRSQNITHKPKVLQCTTCYGYHVTCAVVIGPDKGNLLSCQCFVNWASQMHQLPRVTLGRLPCLPRFQEWHCSQTH